MLVSVCMIVRNEEGNLERALSSIPGSFEKVVVDTGSTDNTVEIAKKLGAAIGYFEWVNDFAAARNYSISLATGKYVLIMDADEALPSGIDEHIERFLAAYPNQAVAFNIANEIKGEIHRHTSLRLFPNNPAFAYHGKVHEMVHYNGQLSEFVLSDLTMHHYGYEEEQYSDGKKANRYLELYHKHLEANPNDGYMLYQLGKLHYSIGQMNLALEAFERCLELNERGHLYYPVMLVMLGYVLKEIGQSPIAEELLVSVQPDYPQFPDLPFLLGLLAMETGKMADIEIHFLRALEIGETKKFSSVEGVGSYKAKYNLAVYYEITGSIDRAIQYYKAAAEADYLPAKKRIFKLS
ncbi:hypothetical protein Back11_52590 [Paenibacillus baekrokdamisoli]|uniref:Uncharacterized protein n=1 Tax=Paenibacillus baekrokdamisoli TaxID=1712516 RepID=A0A3G9JLY9_9BACL|nr:glycosyltransferase family 2 protein [Paenibacillus baekrokdamisoli]MBB3069100.1 glycosyltransferase involved in cell wall biosynthesis [Paenibacillus baekrokdamisoli]BBH23914.1 hypothetical protein Back11_52590 [Paenibacillus baekrokdamisoli]